MNGKNANSREAVEKAAYFCHVFEKGGAALVI